MFDQNSLAQRGFLGFQPVRMLARSCGHVPKRSGVYAVILEPPTTGFLAVSVGGHFKGRDPTVSPGVLRERWLEDVSTLYIGRAVDLSKRLNLLARYGRGEPVAHQGGRYLWQVSEHDRLRVAWRLEDDPVAAENELLEEFEQGFGQ